MDTGKLEGITARTNSIAIRLTHNDKVYHKSLKLKPTPNNLKYAYAQRIAWREQLAKGDMPDGFKSPTELLQHYLDTRMKYVQDEIAPSTIHVYRLYHRELGEAFGQYRVDELTVGDVKSWCREQSGCAKTINNKLSFLRAALGEAYDDEVIDKNILKNWTFKKRRKEVVDDDEINPFTVKEQQKILESFIKEQTRNFYQFMFWSGLRPSEAIALMWDDIDFDNEVIRVRRAKTHNVDKVATTKTKGSRRDVKILPLAKAALSAQRQHTQLQGKHVFINPNTDKPWRGDVQLRKHWKAALHRAGMEYRKPYQTRHTYASMMLIAGEQPLWLQKQMGHSNLSMIIKHYGKWMPDMNENAGNKAAEMFGKL